MGRSLQRVVALLVNLWPSPRVRWRAIRAARTARRTMRLASEVAARVESAADEAAFRAHRGNRDLAERLVAFLEGEYASEVAFTDWAATLVDPIGTDAHRARASRADRWCSPQPDRYGQVLEHVERALEDVAPDLAADVSRLRTLRESQFASGLALGRQLRRLMALNVPSPTARRRAIAAFQAFATINENAAASALRSRRDAETLVA
jgi:hypothetical protein